jgi:hypothetical protein
VTLFDLDDFTVAHVQDAVGNLCRVRVMGDHKHGLAELAVGADKHVKDDLRVLGIEVAGGLVGQHDGWVSDKRPGNGDALLLAAAELGGAMDETTLDGEQVAEMIEELAIQGLLAAADRVGELNIAHGTERGQQIELLEDEGDAMLAQAGALGVVEGGKVDAVDDDAAAGGAGEAAKEVEERGFARAGGTDDGHELAALDGKRDAAHGGDLDAPRSIDLGQVLGKDDGRGWIGHISIVNGRDWRPETLTLRFRESRFGRL